MAIVVDGYNLMYALGLVAKQPATPKLAAARADFLEWLAARLGLAVADVTVVFDARNAPKKAIEPNTVHGLQVLFALRREADDLIEDLIRVAANPGRLTTVSNDQRIRRAARRRGCVDWTCGQFLDWLDRKTPNSSPPAAPVDKPDNNSDSAHWLREFGGEEDQPDWAEMFEADRFEDE